MASNPNRGTRWQRRADRLARFAFQIMLITIVIGLALGLAAALTGGALTRLGSGPGGLWGVPDMILIVTMLLGVPSLILGFVALSQRHWRDVARMLAYFGPLVISAGYIIIPHILDPCARGVWGVFSAFRDIPLCERFGLELNVHTRFHLFWHVAPTGILVAVYGLALRRWHPGWSGKRQQIKT